MKLIGRRLSIWLRGRITNLLGDGFIGRFFLGCFSLGVGVWILFVVEIGSGGTFEKTLDCDLTNIIKGIKTFFQLILDS